MCIPEQISVKRLLSQADMNICVNVCFVMKIKQRQCVCVFLYTEQIHTAQWFINTLDSVSNYSNELNCKNRSLFYLRRAPCTLGWDVSRLRPTSTAVPPVFVLFIKTNAPLVIHPISCYYYKQNSKQYGRVSSLPRLEMVSEKLEIWKRNLF